MKNFIAIFLCSFILHSCNNETKKVATKSGENSLLLHLIPLGKFDTALLKFIQKEIKQFYKIDCTIDSTETLSNEILASSKTRYEANKILKKYNSSKNVLILTEKDIAYNNVTREIKEWGIFGLGYRPGKTCVVSTFRLKRDATNAKFKERLLKVCLHEIGHNLGLPHCIFDSLCL